MEDVAQWEVVSAFAAVGEALVLLPDFAGESRPVGEYNDCTYHHLPN